MSLIASNTTSQRSPTLRLTLLTLDHYLRPLRRILRLIHWISVAIGVDRRDFKLVSWGLFVGVVGFTRFVPFFDGSVDATRRLLKISEDDEEKVAKNDVGGRSVEEIDCGEVVVSERRIGRRYHTTVLLCLKRLVWGDRPGTEEFFEAMRRQATERGNGMVVRRKARKRKKRAPPRAKNYRWTHAAVGRG